MRERLGGILLGVLAGAGWGALILLVLTTGPEPWESRLLFFAIFFSAITISTALLAYWLSLRLFSLKRNRGNWRRCLLQGLPLGVLGLVVALLQSLRLLNLTVLILMMVMVALVEFILLPREPSLERGTPWS